MIEPLDYYFTNGSYVKFHRYTIDTFGVVRNIETGETMKSRKTKGYNRCNVTEDTGKQRSIFIGRAIASTFYGKPPTLDHTADHKDRNPINDTLENIRWLDQSGQKYNRDMPETNKSACIILKDGIEKTRKEWADYLNSRGEKNPYGRDYTMIMINHYAERKQHGFAYKEYPNLPGEIWKEIMESRNIKGRWEISNMNRVKYISKCAQNVLSGDRLRLDNEYPTIVINKKNWGCHILAFMMFFPEEYAAKKPEEIILHKNDDKLDFRPHMLRIGTHSENGIDAHDNGCHDGTKTTRMKCASYVNGEFEKEHESQTDAAKYLKTIGYDRASDRGIGRALRSVQKTAYERTWKLA
jgi:hypothetical protein